jgi:uncharacterized protein YjiS (DUF1127 family)
MFAPTFANPALDARAVQPQSPLARGLATLAQRVAVWEVRAATRRALRDMDPARYPDLGLTTAEVLTETAKPFWVA